jgi:GNAT superfamily N-acetyltransferase
VRAASKRRRAPGSDSFSAPMPASVEVTPVRGFADLRAFVRLPMRLHAGTPWIPQLIVERYMFMSRRLNAFFKHGEAEYFLARRDGRVVGRITAQVNRRFNQHHDRRWGNFGFIEFEDDQEVVDGLLAVAEAWLRERGMERMVGPMDFTMNDESGVLIQGFDREPMIRMPWHPAYYQERLEQAGMLKAMDLLMWELWFTDRYSGLMKVIPDIAEQARTKHGVTIRKMSRLHLKRDMGEFAKVYNAAWAKNWDFVPFTDDDVAAYTQEMQLVFDKDWFMIAEIDGQTIAAALTIPDINQVQKKMKGKLLPFGWWYFLNKKQVINRVRVGFLGVLPEFQHTGVAAALYIEHFDIAESTNRKGGEMGWILETNKAMNRGMEAMGGRIVKRFRIYERLLEEGAVPAAVEAGVAPADDSAD